MRTRTRITLRHLAVAIALLVIVVWLWNLGLHDVNDPPAVPLAFALLRLVALVLALYLLLLTAVSGVVRFLALPRATRVVDRLTLPVLRGMFSGAAALGVMAIPGPIHRLPQTATTDTVVTAPVGDPTATLHLEVPDTTPAPVPIAVPAPAGPDTWVVEPGDSLWSIAASHLADVQGGPVADSDVVVMWERLIDLNRDRLVNPDDPDLIFADQVFELPAMDAG